VLPETPPLPEPPRLTQPTVVVRESWLAGERAGCELTGSSTETLDSAQADFGAYVARMLETRVKWGVPVSTLWYVSGQHYLGELVIRHNLTPALVENGGHIGYSVATPWRRQGHATAMLAAGLVQARQLGLRRVLLTVDQDNEASRKVVLANGGVPDGRSGREDRFWIMLPA
jgi:predicted acetyltransferase